jgi:hypothetical protein
MKNAVLVGAAVLLGAFLAHGSEAPKAAPKLTYKIISAGGGGSAAAMQKDFDELAAYGYRFVGELPGGNLAFEKAAQ